MQKVRNLWDFFRHSIGCLFIAWMLLSYFNVIGCAAVPAPKAPEPVVQESPAKPELLRVELYRIPNGPILSIGWIDTNGDGKCDVVILARYLGRVNGEDQYEFLEEGTCEQGDLAHERLKQYNVKQRAKPKAQGV